MKEDFNVGNIDATAKVYPIRGSFKEYTCVQPSDYTKNKGRNCSITEILNKFYARYKKRAGIDRLFFYIAAGKYLIIS